MVDFFQWLGGNNDGQPWIAFPEAILIMPSTLVIVVAFASIVGMQLSLRCRKTVMAVMGSVGIVVGICALLGWCGLQILDTRSGDNLFGLMVGSFSPFTVLTLLIDPYHFAERQFGDESSIAAARGVIFVFAWAATAAYAAAVWAMYKSMVRNFDMTIRKQSQ